MRAKLRVVEARKNRTVEIPKGSLPLRLERVIERHGLVNPPPLEDRFLLYYLQEESRINGINTPGLAKTAKLRSIFHGVLLTLGHFS